MEKLPIVAVYVVSLTTTVHDFNNVVNELLLQTW